MEIREKKRTKKKNKQDGEKSKTTLNFAGARIGDTRLQNQWRIRGHIFVVGFCDRIVRGLDGDGRFERTVSDDPIGFKTPWNLTELATIGIAVY